MKTKPWTPRPALTNKEIQDLISSTNEYIKSDGPCAKHKQVMGMKSKYLSQYGPEQLKKDYENMMLTIRRDNERKDNRE